MVRTSTALFVLACTIVALKAAPHGHDTGPAQARFIENKGQWDDRVLFKADIPMGSLFVEKDAFTFNFLDFGRVPNPHNGYTSMPDTGEHFLYGHAFQARFLGASPAVKLSGHDVAPEYHNYYLGNNPDRWAPECRLYDKVTMDGLWSGIDLHLYSDEGRLKYDFVVAPGADPARIAIGYDGPDRVTVSPAGHLLIETSVMDITELAPYAYQDIRGERREVACHFHLDGDRLTFVLPDGYDVAFPLVIDPTMIFSTFIGSPANSWGFTATYDDVGNLYAGGLVQGALYPTTNGAYQINYAGGGFGGSGFASDMCITKFNATGTGMIYSTYLGGSDNETPHSLVVNNNNELLVYGRTYSSNFPTTPNAYDNTYNGGADMTVTKFNANGTTLLASTYIGGSGDDGVNISAQFLVLNSIKQNYGDDARGEIIVDGSGNVYVASCTRSTNFPTTPGAFQTTAGLSQQNGCVFKLSSDLSTLLWSTYLGGNNNDAAYSLYLDNNLNVYVCGGTASSNFPTTPGTVSTTYNGGTADAFVVALSANGANMLHGTLLGTTAYDQAFFVQMDDDQDVYVYGQTAGAAFPVTAGVYSNANSGQFITKLDNTLSSIIYSTRFGNGSGFPNISPTAFMVDICENVYAAGWGGPVGPQVGNTFNMSITNDAFQNTTTGGDIYVLVLDRDARNLLYATFIGGATSAEHLDGGTCRFDRNGIIYHSVCAGCWGNSDFPTTPGVWSSTNNSTQCNIAAFKMHFDLKDLEADLTITPSATGCAPLTLLFENSSRGGLQYLWDFDDGTFSTDSNTFHTFTQPGTYNVQLVVFDSTSCNLSDTAYVTITVINDTVAANFTYQANILNCDTMLVFFNDASNRGVNFFWNLGDGTTSIFKDPIHFYTAPGSYTVTLIVEDTTTCNKRDTISQVIDFPPPVQAVFTASELDGCVPLTVSFTHSSINAFGISWDFGDGNTSQNNAPTHTFTTPGTYTVTHHAGNPASCNLVDSVSLTITVHPLPVADFTFNPNEATPKETVSFLNQSIDATMFEWSFGDGHTSTLENPQHAYEEPGDYIVCLKVENDFGCTDSICKTFIVKMGNMVMVPNAFSPNGDGINDLMHVVGSAVSQVELVIFNRWGEQVFYTNKWGNNCPGIHPELDCTEGWDGTNSGKPQQMDTYVYHLWVQFRNGDQENRKGNIILLR